jgi:hypothetical protein
MTKDKSIGQPKKRWHHSGVVYLFGKHSTAKKKEIDYDDSPPSCNNCYAFQPSHHGGNGQPHRPDYCVKHELLLRSKNGLCNTWEFPHGITLETK